MIEQIDEPIEVLANFSGGKPLPLLFTWRKRRYQNFKVLSIRINYEKNALRIYFTIVMNKINYFELCFNSNNMQWQLVQIEYE